MCNLYRSPMSWQKLSARTEFPLLSRLGEYIATPKRPLEEGGED